MRRWTEKYRKDRSFLTKLQWRRRAAEARIGVAAEEAAAVAAAVVVVAGAVVAAAAEHRAHRQQVGVISRLPVLTRSLVPVPPPLATNIIDIGANLTSKRFSCVQKLHSALSLLMACAVATYPRCWRARRRRR